MATVTTRPNAPRKPRPAKNGGDAASSSPAAQSAPRRVKTPRANTRLFYDIAGIALVAVGLILLATLCTPSAGGENVFGRATVHGMRLLVGQGVWLFPFVMIGIGAMLALGKSRSWDNSLGLALLFLVAVAWWHLGRVPVLGQFHPDNLVAGGGVVGAALSWVLRKAVGAVGAHIALFALALGGLIYLFDVPLPLVAAPLERLIGRGGRAARAAAGRAADMVREQRAAERERRGAEEDARAEEERAAGEREAAERRAAMVPDAPRVSRGGELGSVRAALPVATADAAAPASLPVSSAPLAAIFKRATPEPDVPKPAAGKKRAAAAPVEDDAEEEGGEPAPVLVPAAVPRGGVAAVPSFTLPPLSLLKPGEPAAAQDDADGAEKRATLIQTLEDFGIGAEISAVEQGPVITRYEVSLERGIKVSKIVSLADNLAMSLAAMDVRIEAPIPGKSAIGIEVPNTIRHAVTLREVIERPEFINAPGKLTFALGKDVTGVCRYADLAKMPHLLIGGSTGSGKSVGLNTLICSLLYRCTPNELKLLMIDPKKVELSLYEGIPHLAAPVITNVKQAPGIFKQALREMETRYDRFAKAGTRNIEGYNAKATCDEEKLPYWVLIVDELADLMMQSGPEIEQAICRLAQLSRATGIHLVIATQRPSVNVITGLIKANVSSRIAFAVNSAVDSRTILDATGADRLIGRGDMLFSPIDAPKPIRIQGCFVSEAETEALVNYLKAQGKPQFDVLPSTLATIADDEEEEAASAAESTDDELFEPAVKLVVTNGQASTSMLQRRFKVGYTRAARLVDIMQERGIVGPLDGAKPRDILMTRDEVDAMFGGGAKGGAIGQGSLPLGALGGGGED